MAHRSSSTTFETEALSDHTLACIEQSHLLQKTVSGLLVPLGGGTTSYHNNVLLKHQGQSKHGLDSLNSMYSLNDSKDFLFWNPMDSWAPKLCFLEEGAESCETYIKHWWEEETWEIVRGRKILSLILLLLKSFQANKLENVCRELHMGPSWKRIKHSCTLSPPTQKINCSAWDLPWWGNFPQSAGYRSQNVRFKKISEKKVKQVNVTY